MGWWIIMKMGNKNNSHWMKLLKIKSTANKQKEFYKKKKKKKIFMSILPIHIPIHTQIIIIMLIIHILI